ncbi:hypothetical protein OG780_44210 [Streptomyces sp. NBC_00386]|uniref:hypothetical protein n=1 Tax=Streptomyces sp. NBC_00386 TaxID=2975734 RepID=UPI002E1D3B84
MLDAVANSQDGKTQKDGLGHPGSHLDVGAGSCQILLGRAEHDRVQRDVQRLLETAPGEQAFRQIDVCQNQVSGIDTAQQGYAHGGVRRGAKGVLRDLVSVDEYERGDLEAGVPGNKISECGEKRLEQGSVKEVPRWSTSTPGAKPLK